MKTDSCFRAGVREPLPSPSIMTATSATAAADFHSPTTGCSRARRHVTCSTYPPCPAQIKGWVPTGMMTARSFPRDFPTCPCPCDCVTFHVTSLCDLSVTSLHGLCMTLLCDISGWYLCDLCVTAVWPLYVTTVWSQCDQSLRPRPYLSAVNVTSVVTSPTSPWLLRDLDGTSSWDISKCKTY